MDTVHECDRQTDGRTDGGQNYDHKDRATQSVARLKCTSIVEEYTTNFHSDGIPVYSDSRVTRVIRAFEWYQNERPWLPLK